MKQSSEKLWTIEDVAEFCRVKPSIVKYWIRNTDIPYIKLGKHIRFNFEKVKKWVDSKSGEVYISALQQLGKF